MLEKIKALGIEAGKPFTLAGRDEISVRSIDEGIDSARKAIVSAAGGSGKRRHPDTVGASTARSAAGAPSTADVQSPPITASASMRPRTRYSSSTYLDSGGRRLDGANRYVLHFDKGSLPPTDGFWSLSLYTPDKKFFGNPLDRHNSAATTG